MKMTMTAAGDSILIQGYPEGGYAGFDEIRAYLAKGEATFGNLESCLTNWDTYCSAYCGGTWLNAEPRMLDQIADYGFDFLGFANNHSMDFGPDGLLETLAYVEDSGIACAGAGENLHEAAKPVFRTFKGGRVAMIAISSSFDPAAMAGYPSKTLPGRPGLNALRFSTTVRVTKEHFAQLQEIVKATEVNGQADKTRANGFAPPLPEGVMEFGGTRVAIASDGKEETFTACNKRDLARVKSAIDDAKVIADYVVVMFHSHQMKGANMTAPPDFAKEFAHFCIDNGADVILGNGTHEFKPIEIYNGKPIFYSIGNFCFQSNVIERQPSDALDKFGFEEMSDVQALAKKNNGWTTGLHTQIANFLSYLPYMEFDDGKLTHLELKPICLGFDKPRTFKGLPYPADAKTAKDIFDRLNALSAPYGTKMTLGNDGIIQIAL